MTTETVDQRIEGLEAEMKKGGVTVPGTVISRVMLDAALCRKESIFVPEGKESLLVWSLGIGMMSYEMGYAKSFFYGATIDEALSRAEKWLSGSYVPPSGNKEGM